MEPLFIFLEDSALGLWVRGETGASMAFPIIIAFHAIGMGFLAGIASMINLRILGVAKQIPLQRLDAFMPVAWVALVINVISGLLLLVAYPTKALTNPVFFAKLLCIAGALWGLFHLRSRVLLSRSADVQAASQSIRRIAALATLLWVVAIVTGRLLAYTHTRLMST